MSAVELTIGKVKALPEAKVKVLLDWLAEFDWPNQPASAKGIMAVRGVARKFHAHLPRSGGDKFQPQILPGGGAVA
jgi:hypothetical protein